MNIYKKPIDEAYVRSLAKDFGLDLLTASILGRREIERDELPYFLERNPAWMHSPFLFRDMERIIDRVDQARRSGELVMIFGDRDSDGITGTTILMDYFESFGLKLRWRLPTGNEPYGLSILAVDECLKEGRTLIITVDNGISAHEPIAYAMEQGIDVIVLDHHLPSAELPPAYALVDPYSDEDYPFNGLCGCVVALKTISACVYAKSNWYQKDMVLLHAEPMKETYRIEAVRMHNMVVKAKTIVFAVPGIFDLQDSELYRDFLEGNELYVYNKREELPSLAKAFGNVEIHIQELDSEFARVLPSFSKGALFSKANASALKHYSKDELSAEMKLLVQLFISYQQYSSGMLEAMEPFWDLAAVATIADLMPIRDENRIIVYQGLRRFSARPRQSMLPLLQRARLQGKERLTVADIAWYISPVLNATGRLGVPHKAVELLLEKDPTRIQEKAQAILEINEERKKIGNEGYERLKGDIYKNLEAYSNKLVVAFDEGIERGVMGILAARLMQAYQLPAMVMTSVEDDRVMGSMRSPQGTLNVKDFLDTYKDLLIDFGGHPCAGGFSLPRKNLQSFISRMKSGSYKLDVEAKEQVLDIDVQVPSKYLVPGVISIIETLQPFGERFEELKFLGEGVLEKVSLLGNSDPGHLKLLIRTDNYAWPAVYWKAEPKLNRYFSEGDRVRFVFSLEHRYFREQKSVQMQILDMERVR